MKTCGIAAGAGGGTSTITVDPFDRDGGYDRGRVRHRDTISGGNE